MRTVALWISIASASLAMGATVPISQRVKITGSDDTTFMPLLDTAAHAGFGKVTDGTNVAAVKAASTASVASDPSLVVANSPNSPLPAGTNIIGSVSLVDGPRSTYSASFSGLVTAASASDIACLTGSGTKTVKLTRLEISGTTTAGSGSNVSFQIIKRSTADTAGTSSALTAVPYDSTFASATATSVSYTANPTLGTGIGTLRANRMAVATVGGALFPIVHTFAERPGSAAAVLRGTAQQVCINFSATTITGPVFSGSFEWTEE